MRLTVVERGHRPLQKVFLGLMRRLSGRVPGPVLVLSYRGNFFGKAFGECLQAAMRGPGEWSVAERELFAAFVSKKNECAY